MKLFKCQDCGQVLYFENIRCERCSHRLGYLPETATLSALEPQGDVWQPLANPSTSHRFCVNATHEACNWLIPVEASENFCLACRHNHMIPDLSVPQNLERWRTIEVAKHRLFYTLLRLGLPLRTRAEDPEHGLAFDFLAESGNPRGPKVMTGHENGLITIALVEADDVEREKRRAAMHEPYRTLLGHFRHEVGHHFWDVLVRDGGMLEECRSIFGNDELDYDQALQDHYKNGVPADWQENFVSMYATTHPWEDWAETWAHYLHMIDTLEMARSFGMSVHPVVTDDASLSTTVDFDPHTVTDAQTLVNAWIPLSFALNSLNRSMGEKDVYPFVLSPAVIRKLDFVGRVIHSKGQPDLVKEQVAA